MHQSRVDGGSNLYWGLASRPRPFPQIECGLTTFAPTNFRRIHPRMTPYCKKVRVGKGPLPQCYLIGNPCLLRTEIGTGPKDQFTDSCCRFLVLAAGNNNEILDEEPTFLLWLRLAPSFIFCTPRIFCALFTGDPAE